MTAGITQHVVPRRGTTFSLASYLVAPGNWQTRPLRSRVAPARGSRSQRGNITHTTIAVTFSVLSLVCVAALGFFYLQQIFGTTAHGSDVQALETRISDLKDSARALELEGANLRSIQSVEERVEKLNLVSVDRVAYLTPDTGLVAVALP